MNQHTVIVGASQAGLAAAAALRQWSPDAQVTLVGAESQGPYQRPPLSKEYLAGTVGPEILPLRATDFYEAHGITLLTNSRVTGLALHAAPGGGEATLADGRVLPFDHVVLATGARARRLAVPGADLRGVTYLRGLADADNLRERLPQTQRIVVVGGGFVGLEVAAVAEAVGKQVTVVEATDRLLARTVAPETSAFYRAAHERRGATILTSSVVAGFEGRDGEVTDVVLADGRRLIADLVVVGVGAVPRTELAEQAGITIADGIVVDEHTRTSAPGVYAAGDCAVAPYAAGPGGRLRLESVDNAVTQGRAAAAAILGRPAGERPVPWFWSNQGSLRLQIAGLTAGYDHVVVRGNPDAERFSVLYYRGRELLGVDAVNLPSDYMTVRTALGRGMTVPADRAASDQAPLKDLLVPVLASRTA